MISEAVRADLLTLAAMERESASPGEAAAAEALAEMFARRGLTATLEREPAVGGFWQSNGIGAAAGVVAGTVGGRFGAVLGAAAAGLVADDVDNGTHLLRKALPKRQTVNVLAWAGDPDATETIVLGAHHDAAHTGLMFHPGLVPLVNRIAPGWYAKQTTSTHTGQLLALGPALSALGALTGIRKLRRAGVVWSAGTLALLADVARRPVVPAANDNLSAVAVLLALAEELQAHPVEGVRILLLSTGSEESFMEGMRAFLKRHAASLPPATTRFVALECVGSPHLALLEGEGMLRIRDYDASLKNELQDAADRAGVDLWRGLRLGAGGTDALPPLRAGYRAACLAACTELKTPANYHWPTDTPENLSWDTIDNALALVSAHVRG